MNANRTAPGVVEVRMSGAPEDIEKAIAALHAPVLLRRGPYPNRRDPGVRVYLTVQVAP
jgi:hypothetical protein